MSKRQALAEKKERKRAQNSQSQKVSEKQESDLPKMEVNNDGQEYWPITKYKRVSIGSFKGKTNINLREYFEKDGEMLPTKKGITFNLQNWQTLKKIIKEIDKKLKKKQKKK